MGLKTRIAALEEEGGMFGADGRDPELLAQLRQFYDHIREPFSIDYVPSGITARRYWRELLDRVATSPRGRAIHLIKRPGGADESRGCSSSAAVNRPSGGNA